MPEQRYISKIRIKSTGDEYNIEAQKLTGLTATISELNNVDGVTSPIQTQINTVSGVANQVQSDLGTHTANNNIHVTSQKKNEWDGKYKLPESGIPKGDLSSGVQTSLGKADSALQEHQSVELASGDTNGTVKLTIGGVEGNDIAVTGLGSAAYTASTAYDVSGAAATVQSNLNTHTGNSNIHVTTSDKQTWDAKQDAIPANTYDAYGAASAVDSKLTTHKGDTTAHITSTERNTWNAKQDAIPTNTYDAYGAASAVQGNLDTHTGNSTIHVTSTDKTNWNAKLDSSSTLNAAKLSGAIANGVTATTQSITAVTDKGDTKVATTAYVMTAIDKVLEASKAMTYEGVVDSTHALPAAHTVGDTYIVGAESTHAGVACKVGDLIICKASGASASNADWDVVHAAGGNISGPTSSVINNVVTFSNATGNGIKDSGFTIGKSVPSNAAFTDTTYTLTQDSSDGHKITFTPSSGNATTITIPDNNTTYSSKTAASGGTDVSLVTTGEKYNWNNKTSNTGTVTSVAVKMNGTTKGTVTTNGTIDLGTVITDVSGKVDNSNTGADSLLSQLPTWTANPTDDVKLIRRDTAGAASFGQVTFSTVWNYIKGKAEAAWSGLTKTGTVTSVGVTMNGSSKGTVTTSGTIDLGTVLTSHQSASAVNGTSVGSATKGVYINSSGKPTAMTYSVNKDVPSDAKFTDTNTTYGISGGANSISLSAGGTGTSATVYSKSWGNLTLTTSGWSATADANGFYTQTLSVSGMSASYYPTLIPTYTLASGVEDMNAALGKIAYIDTLANSITAYATEKPTADINFELVGM